jgi:GDP-D-mannose dehydratase
MIEPKSSCKIFNICGTDIHEMQYYADKLIEISGLKDVKQEIDKNLFRPIDIEVQLGDSTEVKKLINWEPKISMETILHDLLYYWVEKLNKEDYYGYKGNR